MEWDSCGVPRLNINTARTYTYASIWLTPDVKLRSSEDCARERERETEESICKWENELALKGPECIILALYDE